MSTQLYMHLAVASEWGGGVHFASGGPVPIIYMFSGLSFTAVQCNSPSRPEIPEVPFCRLGQTYDGWEGE